MSSNEILVLVHPGSACGSADFNIGTQEARAARDALRSELNAWRGGILVIDGGLSEELESFPMLSQSIDKALDSARKQGLPSVRVMGDDDTMPGELDQVGRAQEFARALPDNGKNVRFEVTGAWYHPEDGGGCVGSVIQALKEIGCQAELSDSAVHLVDDIPDDEPVKVPSWMKP